MCAFKIGSPDWAVALSGVFYLRNSPIMSTPAQIAANQANAQHSTGPKSAEGRAASSQNNFRHGLTCGIFFVTDWENQKDYDNLHLELAREHAPQTPTEELLVEKLAQSYWLRQRAIRLQRMCTQESAIFDGASEKQLALFIRYQTTHDRAFHAALNALLKLRAEKRKAEIGFESQKQKEAVETRRVAAENRKQELHQWAVLLAEAKVARQQALNANAKLPKSAPASEQAPRREAA